jgi:sterol desaturase/sphingolipid hydroxylase (fatty acid hydroxylase superfamily)
MPDLPDPIVLAIPGFILLLLVEYFLGQRSRRARFETKDTFASLAMGLGNFATTLVFGGFVVMIAVWLYQNRLFDIPLTVGSFILAFVLDDLAYYVFHRSAHRVRWFWASHVIHHSSQFYNFSTALRQTWTGFFSLSFAFRLPLLLIGFPPSVVFFCGALNLVYQFWIHTETIGRLPPWFEAVMNTPSHHRVHHATNPRYLDSNYAGVFIIWDRMFGTFVSERADDPCRYGIIHNLTTHNPLRIATHEWISMARDILSVKRLTSVLPYLFGVPGWSEDGRRLTTDAIKNNWRKTQQEP